MMFSRKPGQAARSICPTIAKRLIQGKENKPKDKRVLIWQAANADMAL